MARNVTKGLENRSEARIFTSPVALAFVRRATAAGLSASEARKRYLDFVRKPAAPRAPRKAA